MSKKPIPFPKDQTTPPSGEVVSDSASPPTELPVKYAKLLQRTFFMPKRAAKKIAVINAVKPYFDDELYTVGVLKDVRDKNAQFTGEIPLGDTRYQDDGNTILDAMIRYCEAQKKSDGDYKPFDYIHVSTKSEHRVEGLFNFHANLTSARIDKGEWNYVNMTNLIAPLSYWNCVSFDNCSINATMPHARFEDCTFANCSFHGNSLQDVHLYEGTSFMNCDFTDVTNFKSMTINPDTWFYNCKMSPAMEDFLINKGADITNNTPREEDPRRTLKMLGIVPTVVDPQPDPDNLIKPPAFKDKAPVQRPTAQQRYAAVERAKKENPDAPKVVSIFGHGR